MAITIGKTATVVLNRFCNLVLKPEPVAIAAPADVTPNPTPDWADVSDLPPVYSSTVQIQGINTPITLSITDVAGDGVSIDISVNTINAYGGTITTYSGPGTTFIVNPNEYVTFKAYDFPVPGTSAGFDVYNDSDGGAFLDFVVLTFFIP